MQYKLISERNEHLGVKEQILINRGFNIEDIEHYLNPSELDNHSSTLINNIDEGIRILFKHLNKDNNKIYVQVDSDCDGFTSSAVLLNYLHRLFPTVVENKFLFGLHDDKSHGIDMKNITEDISLVIAPDSSSNQFKEHEILFNKGIDVLVIDHHLTDHVSEYACIINNQLDDYPSKELSGVGMVYKFCQRIDEITNHSYADDFLDLVSLGLIADMVSLKDFEVHYLVDKGIKQFKNPFMKAMLNKNAYVLGSNPTPIDIAFYIAPFVNAMNRSGTLVEKTLLFESMLEWKAYDQVPNTKRGSFDPYEIRVEQAVRVSTNVKNRQEKNQTENLNYILKKIEEDKLYEDKIIIFKTEKNIDTNLKGLIANKIAPKFQRPVLILTKQEKDGEIYWTGSGRGYNRCDLKDFRGFLLSTNLVEYAEGHSNAFGCSIKDENFNKIKEYINETLKDMDLSTYYSVDFIYNSKNNFYNDIYNIGEMKYLWGQEIEESLIAIEKLKLTKDNLVLMSPNSRPTLKFVLDNGISCIKFHSSQEEYEKLYSDEGYIEINLVGSCDLNEWNGKVTPQIKIKEYEIINKQEFYF